MTYEQLSRKISHHLIDQGGDGQLTPLLRLTAGAGAQGRWGLGRGLRDVLLQARASSACECRLFRYPIVLTTVCLPAAAAAM
jgi:hypothetical protein